MDLITKYPELANYVDNVNGSLRMSEEGMQAYLNQQYTQKQEAYAEVISTNRGSTEADLTSNATNLSRKFTFDTEGGNSFSMASAEDFIKVAKAYAEGNDILGGTSEQINQALKDIGINSDLARQAIMSNTEEVLKMCREYANGVNSVNALSDAFYQANIENEAGNQIRSDLGDQDKEYLTSPVEELLANRAQEIAAKYEKEGMEAGEAFNRGVTEALDEYGDNPNAFIGQAERHAKGEIAAGLASNGMRVDQDDFNQF